MVPVLRTLSAPEAVDEDFHLVLADALRPPFPEESFDTVVTPWLIDIISEDLPVFSARINRLLKSEGRWVNFGSLAFSSHEQTRRYSPEEVQYWIVYGRGSRRFELPSERSCR